MTAQHYEIRLSASAYYSTDSTVLVPPYYYDHIVNTYNHSNLKWNPQQAAALVLFSAFYDGVIALTEITVQGHHAMSWAEEYLRDSRIAVGG